MQVWMCTGGVFVRMSLTSERTWVLRLRLYIWVTRGWVCGCVVQHCLQVAPVYCMRRIIPHSPSITVVATTNNEPVFGCHCRWFVLAGLVILLVFLSSVVVYISAPTVCSCVKTEQFLWLRVCYYGYNQLTATCTVQTYCWLLVSMVTQNQVSMANSTCLL